MTILNGALAAEYQAIAAYQVGAESGLLQKPVLDLAVSSRAITRRTPTCSPQTIKQLGGTPVCCQGRNTTSRSTSSRRQADVLRFAAGAGAGRRSAYLGAVPALRRIAIWPRPAASILGDEAMHWAILRQALGDNPVPAAFVG